MNYLILGLLGITLLIMLWMSAQLARVRAKVAVIPDDADVLTLLRRVDNDVAQLNHAVSGIEPRLAAVEAQLPGAIRHTGIVTYDAFGDITGNLSRSIALLDGQGDGIVISLLVGRSETLFFTKQVRSRVGAEPLSPEEESAVAQALAG
jgi:uncharacterized protein YlxW (UPF0749 family)